MLNKKKALLGSLVLIVGGVVCYYGFNQSQYGHENLAQNGGSPSSPATGDVQSQNAQNSASSNTSISQSRTGIAAMGAGSNGNAGSVNGAVNGSRGVASVDANAQQASAQQSAQQAAGKTAVALTPEQQKALAEQHLAEAEKAAVKAAGCVLATYQTQNTSAKNGPHRFQQNKFKLPEDAKTASNFCVRVDGTPVKYRVTKGKEEILIGAVGKADSAVTIRYCRNHATCAESCVVPKDEFMEALAGDDVEENAPKAAAHWTKTNTASQEEAAADKELEGMEDALNDERKPGVFSAWLVARQTPACADKTERQKLAQTDGRLERKSASIK